MSSKKVYKIRSKYINEDDIIETVVGILVYALVLWITQSLFKGIYIQNFFVAILCAIILNILNFFIKPVLAYLLLPLTIVSFGIAYPIVNVIILKLCDLIMGKLFDLHGFFITFIIALFISFLRLILDCLITNQFRRK